MQGELKSMQQIQACDCSFAAILGDGCVVTGGEARSGGDSTVVQDQLKNVRQIRGSYCLLKLPFLAMVSPGW